MWRQFLLSGLLLIAAPSVAQDQGRFDFGGDHYEAGRSVDVTSGVSGDVFAAGNRVDLSGDIGGSAHVAGRALSIEGDVAGNLYAAGMDVDVEGAVSGNATLAGSTLRVTEPVSGNLRAMGSEVSIAAPIAGSAILGGEEVMLDAVISGDLAIGAKDIDWGEDAQVAGQLHLYVDGDDAPEVPTRVVPADRVTLHDMSEWKDGHPDAMGGDFEPRERGFLAKLGGLFGGVIVVTLLATVLAALAPGFTQSLRERALAAPGRALWMGALGLSAVIGSTVVLAMTGIGVILAPLSIFAAIALGVAGYVVGAYILGVWAVDQAGQGLPDTLLDRAIAAFVGAAILALVALVPFIGWLVVVAVLWAGIGAIVIRLFAPGFKTEV